MGKLLKNIILFLIPLLVLITLLQVDKRYKYQELKDDCFDHGLWVYDRIYNNSAPVDIAFLGSSHTINGIDDQLITENIKIGQAANFGYCRLGRNLSFVLLKEIIQEKDLKMLIIEVREDEDRYSHPIFPYISHSRDVVFANPFFNRDIIADIWTHFAYKVEIAQDIIYQHEPSAPLRTNDFGFASSNDTASSAYLDEVKRKRSIPKPDLSEMVRGFYGKFARVYLEKISNSCNERNINIYFLYLPSYGTYLDKPDNYDIYIKYGKVISPPKQIYDNQTNWADENHLNREGARELSLWLAEQINSGW